MFLVFVGVLAAFAIYALGMRNFDFWRKRGVVYERPYPFVGNIWRLLTLQDPIGVFLKNIHLRHPGERVVGVFLGSQPCLLVRDWELVKLILGRDSDHFAQNILAPHSDIEPIIAKSLFALHGAEWKMLRNRLAPGLNTGKLQTMFPHMLQVVEDYQKKFEADGTIDTKSTLASFTVDVISNAVFGLGTSALRDPGDRMRQVSREMVGEGVISALRSNLAFYKPGLLHFFRLGMFLESSFQTMREVVWESVRLREEGKVSRDDFISHLMTVREKGSWTLPDGTVAAMEGDHFVGQAFMFMAAGFSTTASSLLFCLYEVAKDSRVQDKLREEIQQTFPGDQPIEFNALREMEYLNCVVIENLRLHPGFPFVDRICTQNYKVPDSDLVIEKGTAIFMPMLGLQRDSEHWSEPDKFIPERHLTSTNLSTKPYFPFGYGPKTCLGNRFAILEIKSLLACVLRRSRLSVAPSVPRRLSPNPRRYHDFPLQDVHLELHALD